MSDLKDLIWRIREKVPVDHAELLDLANRVEAQAAENERLREALGVAKMWSDKDWVGYEIVCKALTGATE